MNQINKDQSDYTHRSELTTDCWGHRAMEPKECCTPKRYSPVKCCHCCPAKGILHSVCFLPQNTWSTQHFRLSPYVTATYGAVIWAFTKMRIVQLASPVSKTQNVARVTTSRHRPGWPVLRNVEKHNCFSHLPILLITEQRGFPNLQNITATFGQFYSVNPMLSAFTSPPSLTTTFGNVINQTVSRIPHSLDAKG